MLGKNPFKPVPVCPPPQPRMPRPSRGGDPHGFGMTPLRAIGEVLPIFIIIYLKSLDDDKNKTRIKDLEKHGVPNWVASGLVLNLHTHQGYPLTDNSEYWNKKADESLDDFIKNWSKETDELWDESSFGIHTFFLALLKTNAKELNNEKKFKYGISLYLTTELIGADLKKYTGKDAVVRSVLLKLEKLKANLIIKFASAIKKVKDDAKKHYDDRTRIMNKVFTARISELIKLDFSKKYKDLDVTCFNNLIDLYVKQFQKARDAIEKGREMYLDTEDTETFVKELVDFYYNANKAFNEGIKKLEEKADKIMKVKACIDLLPSDQVTEIKKIIGDDKILGPRPIPRECIINIKVLDIDNKPVFGAEVIITNCLTTYTEDGKKGSYTTRGFTDSRGVFQLSPCYMSKEGIAPTFEVAQKEYNVYRGISSLFKTKDDGGNPKRVWDVYADIITMNKPDDNFKK